MIIFDIDGTLANCDHRRHFVDPSKSDRTCFEYDEVDSHGCPITEKGKWHWDNGKRWKPDWRSFHESCSEDAPIEQVISTMRRHSTYAPIQIWSGRCESVREKTIDWFDKHAPCFAPRTWFEKNLKMRPIGDYTPDDQLKERWLDEAIAEGKTIDMVFDDRPRLVRMYRRRGIFVFNCLQHDDEF